MTDPATSATNGNGTAEAVAAGQAPPAAAQVNLESATSLGGMADAPAAIGQMPQQALGMNPQQQAAVNEAVFAFGLARRHVRPRSKQAVWPMMQSPAHKHLFLNDMEWLVLPPIQANQFRPPILHKSGRKAAAGSRTACPSSMRAGPGSMPTPRRA